MDTKNTHTAIASIIVALVCAAVMLAGAKFLPEGGLKEEWVLIMIFVYLAANGLVLGLMGRKRC